MAARRPKSTGRKKIEIKLIECEDARQVCFSKRRKGLFNKATELAVMCGVEVAAILFSYGHPSVESVLDRFHASNPLDAQDAAFVGVGAGDQDQAMEDLNRELGELRARLEAEKARKEAAAEAWEKARAEGFQASVWLDGLVNQMGEEDLVAFAAALENLQAALGRARADHVLQEAGLTGGGKETMHQEQEQMMMGMPPPPGFDAGMEMMMGMLPPPGFDAGMEMMMGMPPPPGFDAGMEMMMGPLEFGPDGFLL
uniref:Uncharacterized protein n=1 Tax=Avena sativa TaxID=4498 RepID=A0ACD5T913_AVESA